MRERPHDPAREEIQDHDAIEPAFEGPEIGHVRDPDPVRRRGLEASVKHPGRDREGVPRVGRRAKAARDAGAQALGPHQPRDAVAPDVLPASPELLTRGLP